MSTAVLANEIAEAAFFNPFPTASLEMLAARGRRLSITAGTVLMRQHDLSDRMFVVLSGRFRAEMVHTDLAEAVTIAEIGPGESVGEMGLIEGTERSATVIAEEDSEVGELMARDVQEVLLAHPETMWALLRLLSKRIRHANNLVDREI